MTSDGPGKNNISNGTGSVLVLRYSEWSRLLNCPATESQGDQLQLQPIDQSFDSVYHGNHR